MDRNVYISIRGLHQLCDDEGNDSEIELVSPGHYYKRNGKQYVTYKEQYSTDSPSHSATVKVDDNSLLVSSKGEMGGQLRFEPGQRSLSVYDTPFGALMMGVTTQKLQMDLREHNWLIDVDYSIDINNQYTGDHQIRIRVQDGKGENLIRLAE